MTRGTASWSPGAKRRFGAGGEQPRWVRWPR
jgi:hypothetical protein